MKILVAHHKHGDSYFHFDTPSEAAVSALKLFKLNEEQSFYIGLDAEELENDKKEVARLVDEVERAKLAGVSETYITKLYKQLSELRRAFSGKQLAFTLYLKAKKGDSAAALALLKLRRDAEYENWSVKEVE